MGSVAPRALARIEHSEALLAALRARVAELELSHEIVDHLAGFQSGYCSKLLSDPPIRRLGNLSLFLLLQSLGLDLVLIENPQALESLKNPLHLRRRRTILRAPRIVHLTPDFLRMIGAAGARARNLKLSPKRRKALALRAIRARWAKHKRNVRAAAATASQPAPAHRSLSPSKQISGLPRSVAKHSVCRRSARARCAPWTAGRIIPG
jgi:hypothetical protein